LSAMFFASLVNSWRPKQAAASELNWPVRTACGLGEMPWQPRPSLTLNEPHEHRCCSARVRGSAENRVLGRLPCPSDRPCERRAGRLLACARRYPSRSVCAMGAFVGISPFGLMSSTAPSEGQLSATLHLATVAERRGAGRNKARPARHSTRKVRASRTSQLVPAQANRCRYS
jgi:hypothetical protein